MADELAEKFADDFAGKRDLPEAKPGEDDTARRPADNRAGSPQSSAPPARVFLLSDFCLLNTGLESLLRSEPGRFVVAGTGGVNGDALALAIKAGPDLVLLDMDGDAESAMELIHALRARSGAQILLLSRQGQPAVLDQAMRLGARGILDRHVTPAMLGVAIEKVLAGQIWLDRDSTSRLITQMSHPSPAKEADPVELTLAQLTEREKAVVHRIVRHSDEPGKTIADKLNISESTLRNHLTSIYEKFGVRNRASLLAYAFRNQLIERLAAAEKPPVLHRR